MFNCTVPLVVCSWRGPMSRLLVGTECGPVLSAQWGPVLPFRYLQTTTAKASLQLVKYCPRPHSFGDRQTNISKILPSLENVFLYLIWASILLPQTQCINSRSSIPFATKYQIIYISTSHTYTKAT